MTDQNTDEDILLKLTMPGKSLRIDPKDAPQMPAPKSEPSSSQQPLPQPLSAPQQPQPLHQQAKLQDSFQPQRETSTIVPPANTPPATEEAQEDILRKLTMKPKEYVSATPTTVSQVKDIRPPPGYIYQTPEEIRSNKPFVSSDAEVERVKKMAQNIIGSDMVQNRLKKK